MKVELQTTFIISNCTNTHQLSFLLHTCWMFVCICWQRAGAAHGWRLSLARNQFTSIVSYIIMTSHDAAHSSFNTVAILAQGTSWAVAVTQAFCCGWYIRTYSSVGTLQSQCGSLCPRAVLRCSSISAWRGEVFIIWKFPMPGGFICIGATPPHSRVIWAFSREPDILARIRHSRENLIANSRENQFPIQFQNEIGFEGTMLPSNLRIYLCSVLTYHLTP